MMKRWVIAFSLSLSTLAIKVPILLGDKTAQSLTSSKNSQSQLTDNNPSSNKNQSLLSRAKQGVTTVKAQTASTLKEKSGYNQAMKRGEEKAVIREDRTARITQLKDQLSSKDANVDRKAAQSELDTLLKKRTVSEKLEASALFRSGEKQKAKSATANEREERISKIQEELKGPISRQKKFELETEQEALIKKRTLNESIQQSTAFQKAASANASMSQKIAQHSTAIQVGGGILIAGGALAVGGALAAGLGGMAAAKREALSPSAQTPDAAKNESQPDEAVFLPSSFAPPSE